MLRRTSAAILLLLAGALPALAQLPCNPCVGLATDDPAATADLLGTLPALPEEAVLVVKWPVELADDAAVSAARETASTLRAAGARPWYAVRFAAPPPPAERGDDLTAELERLADLARTAEAGSLFQLNWPGELVNEPQAVQEYALALKRASVAVSGAQPDAAVVTESSAGRPGPGPGAVRPGTRRLPRRRRVPARSCGRHSVGVGETEAAHSGTRPGRARRARHPRCEPCSR